MKKRPADALVPPLGLTSVEPWRKLCATAPTRELRGAEILSRRRRHAHLLAAEPLANLALSMVRGRVKISC